MQKFDLGAMMKELEADRPLMRTDIHQLSQAQIRQLVRERKASKGRGSRDQRRGAQPLVVRLRLVKKGAKQP